MKSWEELMIRLHQPKILRDMLGYLKGSLHLRGHGGPPITIKRPRPIIQDNKLIFVTEQPVNRWAPDHTHGGYVYPVTSTTIAQTSHNRFLWLRPQNVTNYGILPNLHHIGHVFRGVTMIQSLHADESGAGIGVGIGFGVLRNVSIYGYEVVQNDGSYTFHFWRDWNTASYIISSGHNNELTQFAIGDIDPTETATGEEPPENRFMLCC